MQTGKVPVLQRHGGDFLRVPWHELDHAGREAGLRQDGEGQVVGGHGEGGGFPEHDVAHEDGRAGEVGADGGEVEGGDGVYEAFEGAVFDAAGLESIRCVSWEKGGKGVLLTSILQVCCAPVVGRIAVLRTPR